MVATYSEGINLVIDTLIDNWNRGNTDGFKPVIIDVADVSPETGKRLDMRNRVDLVFFEFRFGWCLLIF